MSRFLKLCFVPTQSSEGVPAREPNRLIKWLVGAVVLVVGVNLFSRFVVPQKWAWLPAAVLLRRCWSLCRVLVFCGGSVMPRRESQGHDCARADVLSGADGVGIGHRLPLAVMILSLAYLWETGVMLMWPTLRSRQCSTMSPWGQSVCLWVRRS
jgi:hypothetical protein